MRGMLVYDCKYNSWLLVRKPGLVSATVLGNAHLWHFEAPEMPLVPRGSLGHKLKSVGPHN